MMVLNRSVFAKDPADNRIVNDGVVNFGDAGSLRFELQTFVCEGEYKTAVEDILDSYLRHLDRDTQPAVWLSGFFGSGKSHVAKMLGAIWEDRELPDGSRARTRVQLPTETQERLKQLNTESKRHGPLHVAIDSLPGLNEDPGLAILGVILDSAGLPRSAHAAAAQKWMEEKGILDGVRSSLKAKGKSLEVIWPNMFVAPELGAAIAEHYPGLGSTTAEVLKALRAQFPQQKRIEREQFINLARWALRHDHSYRLTALILDEVQQYLGDDNAKIAAMQWVVETLSKNFNGRIIVVATGQSKLTADVASSNLNKLFDRFTLRRDLKETDVQRVVRRVVLEKSPSKVPAILNTMEACSGEIDRHLAGSRIEPRAADVDAYVPDYPLLPTRQRFWTAILRAYDPSEKKGRVRGMLRVVYESTLKVLDHPLGSVIPADAIYHWALPVLQAYKQISDAQTTRIATYYQDADPAAKLKGSLLALIHLIHLLPREGDADTGVRATKDHLADLLVTDLRAGSADLRKQVEAALTDLSASAEVMAVGGEYRLQTSQSQEWEATFTKHTKALDKAEHVSTERKARLEKLINEAAGRVRFTQGTAAVPRTASITFGDGEPGEGKDLQIFVRNEWDASTTDITEKVHARGPESPGITVILPRDANDTLRPTIVNYLAAARTLDTRASASGNEEAAAARHHFEDRRRINDEQINAIIREEVLAHAQVVLDGGDVVSRGDLAESLRDAAERAAVRLFTRFRDADFTKTKWGQVLDRAKKEDEKPLDPLGHAGPSLEHPVVSEVHRYIQDHPVKRGTHIADHFARPPFGWDPDAVVAALAVLLKDKHVRAVGRGGAVVDVGDFDKKSALDLTYVAETITLDITERLKLKKLFGDLGGITCRPNELEACADDFVATLRALAASAGGDAPLPAPASPPKLTHIAGLSGAEQLKAIQAAETDLRDDVERWRHHADRANARLDRWRLLVGLARHAGEFDVGQQVATEIDALREHRSLVSGEDDPTAPLISSLSGVLRPRLLDLHTQAVAAFDHAHAALEADELWQRLDDDQRQGIRQKVRLSPPAEVEVGTDGQLLAALDDRDLAGWRDAVHAMPNRFAEANAEALKLLKPQAQLTKVPARLLESPADVDAWLTEVRTLLNDRLKDGPVQIS